MNFIKTIGAFIGGITIVYAMWYLLNTQRKAEHTALYNYKSSIFLALGSLTLGCVFMYSLLSGLIIDNSVYQIRMFLIFTGLTFLTISMYLRENEQQ